MWITSKNKRLYRIAVLVLIAVLLIPLIVANYAVATTINMYGGLTLKDNQNTISNSNGTVTATAKGSLFSKKTNTITITNDSGSQAKLSFAYNVTSASSYSIDGIDDVPNGNFDKVLAAGDFITITITSNFGLSNTTVTLKLTNIALVSASDSSSVTIQFDSNLGNVTAAGSAVANGAVVDNVSLTDGVALVAAPSNGAKFLGWVDADGKILNTAATYTLRPAEDMTIKAVFAKDGSKPWFGVGGMMQKSEGIGLFGMDKLYYHTASVSYLFDDLNVAATAAAISSSNKAIVLMNSGTLPAGDYTIPAGVTLLIPFDSNNTLYTTGIQYYNTDSAYSTPTEYRTLTMASGATITVNGAVSVSGKHRVVQGAYDKNILGGAPMGDLGFIRMEGTSNITVNNGGALYAYGFITGSGSVTAKSGASIYEIFQIADYRGGDQSTKMQNGVFPVSQYYVQNIEVPLTVYRGAMEYGYATINASGSYFNSTPQFIGTSNAMFNLESGYVVKKYDGSKDRLNIEVYGQVNIASIEIELALGRGINSADYILALNGNITITLKSGFSATVNQDLALIPGSELIIEENAKITLAEGKRVYIYDSSSWGNTYCHGPRAFAAAKYAPSRTYTRTTADLKDAFILVNGTIDASVGYVYTTNSITDGDTDGGANIHSTGTGKVILTTGDENATYQCTNNSAYQSIPINTAWLKNGDGSYVDTSSATSVTTYAYCAEHMAWVCGNSDKGVVNFATNVELGNSLNMYFAFWDPENPNKDWQNHYVKITHKDYVGKIVKETTLYYDKNQWFSDTVNGHSACVVYYKELSTKQMGDTITVELYVAGEAEPIDTWSNSIRHYAVRMLKKYEADENKGTLRTLLVDMLKYGAACQKEFQYNTENLVDAGLSAVQQGWATKEVVWSETLPSGSSSHSANLIVDGNIQFAISGVNDLSRYSFKNHWGTQRDDQEFKPADGYFYISKLYVADARQVITITAGNTTWTDSVEAYCKRMIDSKQDKNDVCTAFMKFSDAAKAYLEGGNRV